MIELYPGSGTRQPEIGLRLGLTVDDLPRTVARLADLCATPGHGAPAAFVDPADGSSRSRPLRELGA